MRNDDYIRNHIIQTGFLRRSKDTYTLQYVLCTLAKALKIDSVFFCIFGYAFRPDKCQYLLVKLPKSIFLTPQYNFFANLNF